MRIKRRFTTENEYLDFAWKFLNFDPNNIWREEDKPLLAPYFDIGVKKTKSRAWTKEEMSQSAAHYAKCISEYAGELFEIRDAIRSFDREEIHDFFFLEIPDMNCFDVDDEGNELDEDGNVMPAFCRENLKINAEYGITFPMTFVGWIDSGFFRGSSDKVMFNEFVEG